MEVRTTSPKSLCPLPGTWLGMRFQVSVTKNLFRTMRNNRCIAQDKRAQGADATAHSEPVTGNVLAYFHPAG